MRPLRLVPLAAVVSSSLLVAVPARADEGAQPAPAPATSSWYGAPLVATDAAALGLFVVARLERGAPLLRGVTHGDAHAAVGAPYGGVAIGAAGAYFAPAIGLHAFEVGGTRALLGGAVRLAPLALVQLTDPLGGVVGFFVRDSHGQRARCAGGSGGVISAPCVDLEEGSHGRDGAAIGADVGIFAGLVAAMVVDDVVLARTPPPRAAPADHAIAPSLRVDRSGAAIGAVGRF